MPSLDQPVLSRVEFSCHAPDASSVVLAGRFDRQKLSLRPMTRTARGDWSAVLALRPGRYLYKFLVVYRGLVNMREDSPAVVAKCDRWN